MLESNKNDKRKKVSARDICQCYTSEKARSDMVAQTWIYLVLRPISFYLTPLFINLGFSANTVTCLGLFPLLGGMALILLGSHSPLNFTIGAMLVNIWYLGDAIDGNIARFQGQTSKFGAILDWLVGMLYHTFLPVCLGLGLYLASPERAMLALGLDFPKWIWLLAGAVRLFAELLREVVSLGGRKIVGLKIVDQIDSKAKISLKDILPRIFPNFEIPLLLVSSLVGVLGFFLLFYTIYNLAILAGMILLALRKALLADQQRTKEGENL